MNANITFTLPALAALVLSAAGCNGQPKTGPFDGTPTTQAAAVPMDLGVITFLDGTPMEIIYDLDSRFLLTVTKEQLRTARTIQDVVPEHLKEDGLDVLAQ
jgi:hypothetical protein